MERLQPLSPEEASSPQKALLEQLPAMKLFRTMAHAPEVTQGFVQYGSAILFNSQLDPIWREIVILAVAHYRHNDYEIHEHERIAGDVGCPRDKVVALREAKQPWDLEIFDEQEKRLMRYALDMVADGAPSDESYAAVSEFLSPQEIVELTLCVAFYWGAAMFIDAFGLTPEQADFSDNVKIPEAK